MKLHVFPTSQGRGVAIRVSPKELRGLCATVFGVSVLAPVFWGVTLTSNLARAERKPVVAAPPLIRETEPLVHLASNLTQARRQAAPVDPTHNVA